MKHIVLAAAIASFGMAAQAQDKLAAASAAIRGCRIPNV
jgi:hypothetical protein